MEIVLFVNLIIINVRVRLTLNISMNYHLSQASIHKYCTLEKVHVDGSLSRWRGVKIISPPADGSGSQPESNHILRVDLLGAVNAAARQHKTIRLSPQNPKGVYTSKLSRKRGVSMNHGLSLLMVTLWGTTAVET